MTISFSATTAACLLLVVAVPALAAGVDNMQMGMKPAATSVTGYRFELAGAPLSSGSGRSIVSIRFVHNGKPVTGAIIFQSRADMGPMGMAAMTAPVKPLGEKPSGIYRFEVTNGPVWNKPDNWAFTLGAKVQAVAETVHGVVIVRLAP